MAKNLDGKTRIIAGPAISIKWTLSPSWNRGLVVVHPYVLSPQSMNLLVSSSNGERTILQGRGINPKEKIPFISVILRELNLILEEADNYLVNTGIAPENVVYGDLYCELGKDPIVGGYGGRVMGKNVSRNR